MRYAIFSDVHANRQAWEAVLADALSQGADTLVCLGDVIGYGPKPLEVLGAVRKVTPNFVLGNHDAAACGRLDPSIFNDRARIVIEWTRDQLDEESMQFLEQVPLQMDGENLQFVHAEIIEPGEYGYVDGPESAELNLKAMTHPLAFIGHTHLPLAFAMPRDGGAVTEMPPIDFQVEEDQRYLINVGSVGEPRTSDVRASYVIYDDVERRVFFRKVVFDVAAYKADLAESGLEILPFFVQLVDAGGDEEAPEPVAAPQLALAHLPKVAEVVSGHHGRLVLNTGPALPGRSVAPVVRSQSIPGWVIGIIALVIAGGLIGVVALMTGGRKGPDEGTAGAGERSQARPAAGTAKEGEGAIRNLVLRHYERSFEDLDELRRADKLGEAHLVSELPDGMLNLADGGESGFGLVWEGVLEVPGSGVYQFSLDASSGAALVLGEDTVLKDSGLRPGSVKSTKVILRQGRSPIRLEYVHLGGEKSLSLRWSGPGVADEVSLVRTGPSSRAGPSRRIASRASGEPDDPGTPTDPATPVEDAPRVAPDKLSEALLAYWSFDSREVAESRFKQLASGAVTEHLVARDGQAVRYLRPESDPGREWIDLNYDAKSWEEGTNGIGYEDEPGAFRDLITSRIASARGKHPHSVYLRIPFEVEDPDDYEGLALYMRYDDGFVAYLNGALMASRNAPESLKWNSGATKQNKDEDASKSELFKVGRSLRGLKKGRNVLAIHALNAGGGEPNESNTGCTSSDMLILPELIALRKDKELPEEASPREPSPHDLVVEEEEIKGTVSPAEGRFGEAYKFGDGSLEIGSKNKFALADQELTVSLWFTRRPDSADGQARRLISAGAGSDEKPGWALWVMTRGEGISFAVSDGSRRHAITFKDDSLLNGRWHHAAATVDRQSNMLRLFLNGQLVADQRVDALEGLTVGSHSGLSVGKNSDDTQFHRGMIDDVVLWRRALLPEEIEEVFEADKPAGDLLDAE